MTPNKFKELYDEGLLEEHALIKYLQNNAVLQLDRQTMAHHNFDIADILNGRIKSSVPRLPIVLMIERWNKTIGFQVINPECYK